MTIAISPTAAHETQEVDGYNVTFGGADEPIITGERMWLEFEIVDNETGDPVENQAETLTVSIDSTNSEKTALELTDKYDEPGVYEAPVIFTEPGDYVVHLEGSLEDTDVHTHFEKRVHKRSELEYPTGESSDSVARTESQVDDVRTDEAGFSVVHLTIATLSIVAVVGLFFFRQRN